MGLMKMEFNQKPIASTASISVGAGLLIFALLHFFPPAIEDFATYASIAILIMGVLAARFRKRKPEN
jgi:hypothetical protein